MSRDSYHGGERHFTLPEVAADKGVTRPAVLYAIRRGALPAVRVGRLWLVKESDMALYEPRKYERRDVTRKARRAPRFRRRTDPN